MKKIHKQFPKGSVEWLRAKALQCWAKGKNKKARKFTSQIFAKLAGKD